MAQPTDRASFKEYCLRKLGHPLLEINVTEEQVEDRIDQALIYYADYHFDGSEHTYLKHQITQADVDNGYIPVSNNVMGIVGVFDVGKGFSSSNMFDFRYQMALHDLWDLSNVQLQYYTTAMMYVSMVEEVIVGSPLIRYNRHVNKLHIDMDWARLNVGEYIVVEAYITVDPDTYPDVWKDRWLQEYASILIKEQWGNNLTKFTGMQLPGGVQFNGERILQDAMEARRKMEDEMINSFSLPAIDMIG